MRNLPREVIAAIETAVELNGVLESAEIHSLAKIYKTSPQAVVWNMKRYNKVKAGCDDRKKGGRPAAMDKDKATEFLRNMMAEIHKTGSRIKMVEIAEKTSEEFGIHVSSTWVSRLMKTSGIPHKEPKPPKAVRIPKPPKPSRAPAPQPPIQGYWVPQYALPAPGQYPLFREDLQQAMAAGPSGQPLDDRPRIAPTLPPVAKRGRPPIAKPVHTDGHPPDFEGFGILKLTNSAPPPITLPPMSAQHSILSQYQYSPNVYPPRISPTSSSSNSESSTPSEVTSPAPGNTSSCVASQPPASDDWEVLKVVELPSSGRMDLEELRRSSVRRA